MRKNSILIMALFIVWSNFSQEISFGVKGGLNLSDWNTSLENEKFKMSTLFHVGGIVEIALSDQFSLQPEILFSSKGVKDIEVPDSYNFVLNYIDIPVMAKYYVAEGFSLEVGPQLGILTSAKITDGNNSEDMKEYVESTEFALGVGMGYGMENGFFVNVRYNLGLSDIDKDTTDNDYVKNNVIQFSVGYMFK